MVKYLKELRSKQLEREHQEQRRIKTDCISFSLENFEWWREREREVNFSLKHHRINRAWKVPEHFSSLFFLPSFKFMILNLMKLSLRGFL